MVERRVVLGGGDVAGYGGNGGWLRGQCREVVRQEGGWGGIWLVKEKLRKNSLANGNATGNMQGDVTRGWASMDSLGQVRKGLAWSYTA